MNKKTNLKFITEIGMISAIYITVSLVLSPISFGASQIRIAEALTILPVFNKRYIYGLTLGCFLTNFIGAINGQNILGFADSIIGTTATLFACYLTYYLRKYKIKGVPFLSMLPPVIVNAFIIGAELTFAERGKIFDKLFWVNASGVAIGQVISCCLCGVILFIALSNFLKMEE